MKEKAVTKQTTRENRQPLSRQIALTALWALLGLLMPRAAIFSSLTPFGVSLAAAVPAGGAAAVYLTTVIGYLLPGSAVLPLRYVAAVVAVAGIRWSLNGIQGLTGRALFAPLVTFLGVECTGFAMAAAEGLSVHTLLTILAEGLLAAGAAYFFQQTASVAEGGVSGRVLTVQQQASVVATGAVALMAVAGISFSGISPGRMAAAVLILLLARCGKEQGGSIAGIVLGLAMSLTGENSAYIAAAYSFGGLLAGMFSRVNRFAAAGSFIGANALLALAAGTGEAGAGASVIIGVYEAVGACVIYVSLPLSLDRKIHAFFTKGSRPAAVEGIKQSAVMRLDFASKAMEEVAGTVETVSNKLASLSAPDLGSVYRRVAEEVCPVCGLCRNCWEGNRAETLGALEQMAPLLREKGRVTTEDVPPVLARKCARLEEVVSRLNTGYWEFALREGAWRRLAEIRGAVTDQFASMSGMLEELAEDFDRFDRVETEASTRVAAVCERHGLSVRDAVCLLGQGDRMRVEILVNHTGARLKKQEWEREIGNACGREFDHPDITRLSDAVKIVFIERTEFTVSIGSAQLACTGERLCGDAFESFTDGERLYAVLSDGMGSGGRAAVDGAMASGLISRLLQAGFGADSALRMVNSALMVKSGDESIATVDIACIDLFSGRLDSLKAGAAPSFLRSMGRVSRIEKSSLPVGILRDIVFERTEDRLVDGDVLLVFSDGLLSEGMEWVEEALRDYEGTDMQALADSLAQEARRRQGETREDDITVLALRVSKREN